MGMIYDKQSLLLSILYLFVTQCDSICSHQSQYDADLACYGGF